MKPQTLRRIETVEQVTRSFTAVGLRAS